jgi:hypothetical protein
MADRRMHGNTSRCHSGEAQKQEKRLLSSGKLWLEQRTEHELLLLIHSLLFIDGSFFTSLMDCSLFDGGMQYCSSTDSATFCRGTQVRGELALIAQ